MNTFDTGTCLGYLRKKKNTTRNSLKLYMLYDRTHKRKKDTHQNS